LRSAFDVFPSRKGAAIHIDKFARCLANFKAVCFTPSATILCRFINVKMILRLFVSMRRFKSGESKGKRRENLMALFELEGARLLDL
jgi:hypothetical protein